MSGAIGPVNTDTLMPPNNSLDSDCQRNEAELLTSRGLSQEAEQSQKDGGHQHLHGSSAETDVLLFGWKSLMVRSDLGSAVLEICSGLQLYSIYTANSVKFLVTDL